MSIISLLSIFSLQGIGVAVIKSVAQGEERSWNIALKSKIKWGVLGSFISIFIGLFYYFRGDFILGNIFLFSSIIIPFYDSVFIYTYILQGKRKFDLDSKFTILKRVFFVLIMIVVILFFNNNIYILTFTSLIIMLGINAIFLLWTIKTIPLNNKQDLDVVKYGKNLTWISIIINFSTFLDKFLIFYFLSPIELAVYTFALLPVEQLNSLLGSISALILPKFATRSTEFILKGLKSKMIKYGIIISIIIVTYIILAPFIYKLLFPRYTEAIKYSQISVISLLSIIATIPIIYLRSKKKIKQLYIYNIIYVLLRVSFVSIGFYFWGMIGIVIAVTLVKIVIIFISLIMLNDKLFVKLKT